MEFFDPLAQLMAKPATVSQTEDHLAALVACDSPQCPDSFEQDGCDGKALFRRKSIERLDIGPGVARERLRRIVRRFLFLLLVQVDEDFRPLSQLQGLKAARAARLAVHLLLNNEIPTTGGADCDCHVAALLSVRAGVPRSSRYGRSISRPMLKRAAPMTWAVAPCLGRDSRSISFLLRGRAMGSAQDL
jgi:hypothetical protein